MHSFFSKQSYSAGSTLIELMLYAAISSIILLGASLVSANVLELKAKSIAVSDVRYAARMVFHHLAEPIRSAESISSPALNATGTEAILFGNTPTTIRESNGSIELIVGTEAPITLLPSGVRAKDVVFEHVGAVDQQSTLRVRMTLESGEGSALQAFRFERMFTGSFTLRGEIP